MRLFQWRWLHRRTEAAEARAVEAERVAAEAADRWPEVTELTDRFAEAAIRSMRRPPARRPRPRPTGGPV